MGINIKIIFVHGNVFRQKRPELSLGAGFESVNCLFCVLLVGGFDGLGLRLSLLNNHTNEIVSCVEGQIT